MSSEPQIRCIHGRVYRFILLHFSVAVMASLYVNQLNKPPATAPQAFNYSMSTPLPKSRVWQVSAAPGRSSVSHVPQSADKNGFEHFYDDYDSGYYFYDDYEPSVVGRPPECDAKEPGRRFNQIVRSSRSRPCQVLFLRKLCRVRPYSWIIFPQVYCCAGRSVTGGEYSFPVDFIHEHGTTTTTTTTLAPEESKEDENREQAGESFFSLFPRKTVRTEIKNTNFVTAEEYLLDPSELSLPFLPTASDLPSVHAKEKPKKAANIKDKQKTTVLPPVKQPRSSIVSTGSTVVATTNETPTSAVPRAPTSEQWLMELPSIKGKKAEDGELTLVPPVAVNKVATVVNEDEAENGIPDLVVKDNIVNRPLLIVSLTLPPLLSRGGLSVYGKVKVFAQLSVGRKSKMRIIHSLN